jgi:deazaflavin-dependent oxidoreductase (nitroreductase family)
MCSKEPPTFTEFFCGAIEHIRSKGEESAPRLAEQFVNSFVKALLRLGVKVDGTHLLSVKGRRSGKIHTTPVTLIEEGGQRWLVAPYGEVNWVRNARAAGRVTLRRGRHAETVSIVELNPEERAPVLKEYLKRVPLVQPYFDTTPDSSLEAFVAEAARHPVFRMVGSARS